jgi:AcrR family transcriptional regulator
VPPDRDPKSSARDAVLNAAEIVIDRDGVSAFTLDAVAKESGVSKGGLLHHFPTKDALLLALVTRMADEWRTDYEAAIASVPEGPARVARGLLNACIADPEGWNDHMRRSGKVMMAAMIANPNNVKPARDAHDNLLRLVIDDNAPRWAGEAIVFAMHGLWFSWLFGLIDATPDRLAQVRASLQQVVALVECEVAIR